MPRGLCEVLAGFWELVLWASLFFEISLVVSIWD